MLSYTLNIPFFASTRRLLLFSVLLSVCESNRVICPTGDITNDSPQTQGAGAPTGVGAPGVFPPSSHRLLLSPYLSSQQAWTIYIWGTNIYRRTEFHGADVNVNMTTRLGSFICYTVARWHGLKARDHSPLLVFSCCPYIIKMCISIRSPQWCRLCDIM